MMGRAQSRMQGISGRHAPRALQIAEQVERYGASFASVHRPRAAQPFLPRHGASASAASGTGGLDDRKGDLGDPDPRLPGPVNAVDSRSTFAEAWAQRRPPGGPGDDPVVMRTSRLLFEVQSMNNNFNERIVPKSEGTNKHIV
ncbi:hypothetical protein ACOMHN_039335 [Nucella lapillus]